MSTGSRSLPRRVLVAIAIVPALLLASAASADSTISARQFEAALAQAASESTDELDRSPVISLPTAEGALERFAVEEVSLMEPGLAARFPQIRTFRGIGLDDPAATARLDLTPSGFHAMVLSPAGTVFVEPEEDQPFERGRVIHSRQLVNRPAWHCSTPPRPVDEGIPSPAIRAARAVAGDQIRTYRIAIATTAEYTAFHGGTVDSGLAEVVTVLNRVSGVLERDVAIRLLLVDRNDRLIYTDPGSDPYTNEDPQLITGENQTNVDRVIGPRNYDIGHVFSAYNGGRADGLVCIEGRKAMAVSGLTRPTTEFFAIQLVAHEIGHQFGASHTYNSSIGICGDYRIAAAAWEPGSGSTIMSYAGICAEENVARRGGDYFHTGSLDEILGYVGSGQGATCGEATPSGNRPPTSNAGRRYRIPIETPFELVGSGTDPDGDPLTYVWEQFDLGPPSPPMTDDGQRPLFRSWPPVTEPIRVIPRVRDLRRGRSTKREVLPTSTRELTFRLTVRDGRGGVARDTVTLQVTEEAGPFRVLEPQKRDLWTIGREQSIVWDVADTHRPPVRCKRVDLSLSTDAGRTFPYSLAEATRNDGFKRVTVPPLPTGRARIKVACSNNLFLALSEGNFKIQP